MKIKFNQRFNYSPDGINVDHYQAGEEADLDDKLAKRLVGSRIAKKCKVKKAPANKALPLDDIEDKCLDQQ